MQLYTIFLKTHFNCKREISVACDDKRLWKIHVIGYTTKFRVNRYEYPRKACRFEVKAGCSACRWSWQTNWHQLALRIFTRRLSAFLSWYPIVKATSATFRVKFDFKSVCSHTRASLSLEFVKKKFTNSTSLFFFRILPFC